MNKITFRHNEILDCGSPDPTTYFETANLEFSRLFQLIKLFLEKRKNNGKKDSCKICYRIGLESILSHSFVLIVS